MRWTVETLDTRVDEDVLALPADMQARFHRIGELIEAKGLPQVREPHVSEGDQEMTSLKDLKARSFKNPKVKAAYDQLEDEYAFAAALIEARAKAKLTQAQLARRMGTTQSAIARLESGRTVPSGATLIKFAKAVGRTLRVDFR